ncbi:MAG: ABC transporter permease subunit [Chloroflexi bacterium]|nr:ABC transporter permease subunit [Chloroflexota bacterium]
MTSEAIAMAPVRHSAVREFIGAVATIMVKELRSRMRGRRAFILLTIYLGLLALIAYGVYLISAPATSAGFGMSANASAMVGSAIFMVLSIFQLILICFIAPAATAGQVSLEREKQTLDLLISTPMRPGAIVVGKLAAALAYVVLMIVAAIPITAIVLMYGGATVMDIVHQQVVLLAVAVGLGAVGLFYSALLKRTQAATVLTYITVLAMTLGTTAVFVFWMVFANQSSGGFDVGPRKTAPEALLYVNPGVAMLDVISATESTSFGGISSMLAGLRGESVTLGGNGMMCDESGRCQPIDNLGNPIDPDTIGPMLGPGYWWSRISITLVIVAVILTVASMRLIVPPGMRGGLRRRHPGPAANLVTESADAGIVPMDPTDD